MKCATSSLHEQLNQQPGIFMSELKEPNFFSNDEEYNKGSEWYLSHFEEANINDLIGESSTHYTKLPTYPHTIERLQKYLPDAKFIYVMRHLINRLVSQYIHEWSQRVISVGINESIDPHPELLEYSLYTKQLQPYFDTFGQERVLPIFFERMLTTPQTELERICRFIGYKDKPQWYQELNASNVSNQRMIKSAWRDAIVETPGLKQLRRLLILKSFRTWVRSLWTIKKKPDLTAENIDRLTVIFDEDLAVLGSWLGVDLTCDNFQETVKNSSLDWVNITRT
ncbi:sulfotransferase family protein [Crocosphaera watsonii WH 8501]|uniref:Sulfotransferase n=1 Tax=Crocosphaera watsonii WH 8501 TaxID=165597 RepID=Q4C8T3_CROWT|nr:sulfotransferase [Crocosphaera watsonii]EAM52188.1 Sulfotransferase [Crocosphaera watsonii WH 8501]